MRHNVYVFAAIGVSSDGFRGIIGAAEGMREDKEKEGTAVNYKYMNEWLAERGIVPGQGFADELRRLAKEYKKSMA